jgi:cytochrome c biogenesis protein CcdA
MALMPTIDALARQYPTLHVYKYEIQNDANYSLFQKFLSAYGLKFDTVPTVVIGKEQFQGDEYASQIKAAVAQGVQNGTTGPGDSITGHIVPMPSPTTHTGNATKNSTSSAHNSTLVDTQGALPLPLFITTGIISGINPCVFSVLIFLMGTIALTGSRSRALAIGVAYIATVFVVFFLAALAVVSFVRIIGASNLALTKTAIGIFLLVVGIVSIKDFFWYGRWFSFKIPTFTKHSISTLGKTGSFIAIIGLGFIATIAALPCTIGPFTYFSTTYLASMPAMQNNLYTALFSLAFVLPMILVFVAIYAVKVSTDRAEEWRMKSARYMRLLAGLLMVTFGLLLVFKVF